MKNSVSVGGTEELGIKDGKFVIQRKVMMNEELRRIQNEVYSLEDKIYGNKKYGSKGLYGTFKACRLKRISKENGGNGQLVWTEPIDRLTEKEEEWNIGIDEEDKIVAVSQEFLKDRIKRFKTYKKTLLKREDEYEEKIEICKAKLKSQLFDLKKKNQTIQSSKVERE